MDCECTLIFNPAETCFSLSLPAACVLPHDTAAYPSEWSDLSQVCMLCADDQNAPRLQMLNAAQAMGIPIQQARNIDDVKHGVFRDEPNIKLFGATIESVKSHVWQAVAKEWEERPAMIILDQNIDFDCENILGTDICQHLREIKFIGVILIRSANDNESDKVQYKTAGAVITCI